MAMSLPHPGPFAPGSINLADRKHIKDAIRTRDFSVGEYIVGMVSKAVSLNYTFPVLDAHQNLIAVVIAGFNLNEYARFLSKVSLPKGSAVVVTDWRGVPRFARIDRFPLLIAAQAILSGVSPQPNSPIAGQHPLQ